MSNTERLVMIPLAPHTHREREREREKEGERQGHRARDGQIGRDRMGVRGKGGE